MIPKGTIFHGPDGMGYEMTRDVTWGDIMRVDDMIPFGGAPKPTSDMWPPLWLEIATMEFMHEQSQKD
jgi:hypothetical protein